MNQHTIVEAPSGQVTEGAKARWWRKNTAKLSVDELALLTGYTADAIRGFEEDRTALGRKVNARMWQRYRVACFAAGVSHNVGYWDWGL